MKDFVYIISLLCNKGETMNVSSNVSSTATTPVEGKDPIKKAIEVQEQQVQTIIDSASELSKEITSQKTGMGNSLNITG